MEFMKNNEEYLNNNNKKNKKQTKQNEKMVILNEINIKIIFLEFRRYSKINFLFHHYYI